MPLRSLGILILAFILPGKNYSQPLITKTGSIGFYSRTPFEDIQAENNQVYAVLDRASHRLAFALLMRGFMFPRELMQEHFNENYVESDKYPKASFTGGCSGEMDFSKDGIYEVVIKGDLSIHGVTRPLETTAQIEVKTDCIIGTASFKIDPENFNIKIPGVVREKIAREISLKINTKWIPSK